MTTQHQSTWLPSLKWLMLHLLRYIPSRRIRLFLLRKMGAKIAQNVSMFGDVNVRCPSKLVIEKGCSIGPGVLLDARAGLTIRSNATIAYQAIIWTVDHDVNSRDFHTDGKPVEICEYAWVCSRSIILPGVKIGRGAVVASGAVVTHDVAPFTIVGGVPAQIIGKRNEDLDYSSYFPLHIV